MAKPGETICPNCHAGNAITSTSCWKCAAVINSAAHLSSPPTDKMRPIIKAVQIIGVAVILFIVVGFVIWIANGGLYKDNSGPASSMGQSSATNPSPPTGSSIAVGTNITLDGSNYETKEVFVALSEFYLDQYIDALQKKDVLGAVEMTQSGTVFRVPSGTHGLLLEMNPPKAKIRIYGPPDDRKKWKYFGQAGWVLSAMVKAK